MVRSSLFNAAFYPLTAVMCVLCLPALLSRRATLECGRLWCRIVRWLLRRCIGLDYTLMHRSGGECSPGKDPVQGPGKGPGKGPAIYAIKHQSAWETLMLPLIVDDPAFVLKRELLFIPLFGWYLARLGMIGIDRGGGARALRRMCRAAKRRLAEGRPVVIFPEGTRVAPGAARPFLPGIAALYAMGDAPVVPVALNSGLFWGRRAFHKKPGRVTVALLAPIGPGLGRDAFMARLRDRIDKGMAALPAP